MDDLSKRCYIANEKKDLEKLLIEFNAAGLPSKWFAEIIDKYVYPLDKGNPGPNIAEYLASL